MSNVIEIFGIKKTVAELKEYAEAQFHVITRLSKETEQLKAEKRHLEALLKASTPVISLNKEEDVVSNEEKICKEQITIFKNLSTERELTLEETKKVEIYTKILFQIKQPESKKASPVEKLDTKALLKLVEDNDPKIG